MLASNIKPSQRPIMRVADFSKNHYPGIILSFLLGIAALTISQKYAVPVMLCAILIGLALHPSYESKKLQSGIDWCARPLLLTGVALLGFRVNVHDFSSLGMITPFIVLSGLALTIIIGTLFGRVIGMPTRLAILISGSVAICGVSAAVAISAALPKRESSERDLALTIAGVTVISTLAMISYPLISMWMNHSSLHAGVFIGASIHDVAQVVGAGYSISESAGNTATLVKLLRVSALLPVVLIISFLYRHKKQNEQQNYFSFLPTFLIVYLIIAGLNSSHFFPAMVQDIGIEASKYCLIISLVAIGLKTNLSNIKVVGKAPLILLICMSLFLAIISLIQAQSFL